MNDLTLDELNILLSWYRRVYEDPAEEEEALRDKIKQAIKDLEFEESTLNF